jgi:two-component system cell cycle response regulator
MGPRSSRSIRKKILIWTSGGRHEPGLAECLRGTGYEPVVYTDVHDVVAVSAAEVPDLIVLDVDGGSSSAEGVIAQLAARGADKNLPILVLAGADDAPPPSMCEATLRVDWLELPWEPSRLIARIKAMLRVIHIEGAREMAGVRDGLTRLYNRRHFDERLEKEIERARRYGRQVSCILLDIDRLDEVNERHGHRVGDELIRSVSDIMLAETRASDFVARYGGEEFALILPETTGNDAGILSERVRRSVGGCWVCCGEDEVTATISCGVATYPDHARDAATLIRMADSAVYQAKGQGGNCTVIAFADTDDGRTREGADHPKILLIEDNEYNRSVASLVLRASGYDVIEAPDGQTALSLARSSHPDLVLIDLQIEGMDGLEATRQLVEMDETKGVPIVALTAKSLPKDLEELVAAGCRGYIVKPIDTNNLASQVQAYLEA